MLQTRTHRLLPFPYTPQASSSIAIDPGIFWLDIQESADYIRTLLARQPIKKRVQRVSTPPTNPLNGFSSSGNWTREQCLLAFKFYCETPFGQLHGKNKLVVDLAALIGRTPGALAMKCVNFASLDPAIRESGRSGLGNVSALDREIWDEFHANWTSLVEECDSLLVALHAQRGLQSPPRGDLLRPEDFDFTGETRATIVQQRVKQDFFRRSVLSSYGYRCCISGVSDRQFLVASHIVAWRDDASIRLHPANGLCLSTIHDRAFDSHLFTLTEDRRIILSDRLRNTNDEFLRQVFWPIDGKPISLPEKFAPEATFVDRHRQKMLESSCKT